MIYLIKFADNSLSMGVNKTDYTHILRIKFKIILSMSTKDFEKEYNKLYLPLCMFALRILENTELAEDAVQESFMAVWKRIQTGYVPDNFKNYIYYVVRSTSLSYLKTNKLMISNDVLDYVDIIPDEYIDTSERDAELWKAIDSLPKACRKIFLLSKKDGLTYNEIAEHLGLSPKTVEHQISKALKYIRGKSMKIYNYFLSLGF